MQQPQHISQALFRLANRTTKEILEDDWSIYLLKMFLRAGQPRQNESQAMKILKCYQITKKMNRNLTLRHRYTMELIEAIHELHNPQWSIIFDDLRLIEAGEEEYEEVLMYLQQDLLEGIERSPEYQEFRITLSTVIMGRRILRSN